MVVIMVYILVSLKQITHYLSDNGSDNGSYLSDNVSDNGLYLSLSEAHNPLS